MEGIEGVRLPELREPYNWTTEELLRDLRGVSGRCFKIAHILDGGHLTRLYDTVNNTVNNTECDIIIMQESVYSAHACI